MKACPTCYRLYPDDAGFCAHDGGKLLAYEQVGAQPDASDRLLGTRLCGRYEMRRIVADGGMGRVYEARDAQHDRRVAIKVLHPEVARDPIAVERFRREYEISKDLPHDHIVEVLDFQTAETGQYIMVMEFLEGEELRNILQRESTVTPARMIRVLSQVALGLDEAHRRQFVHRDLKPDNLFLCGTSAGDEVKILDFGSARINKNRQMSKLTSMGTTIGSPFYMSPEQAQGAENLDHRADVFALGAIAYEALAGQVPFQGANGPAILLAILTKNPPPLTTRASTKLPSAIDDVIDDALAKKPEMRTPTVGALADAFGRAFGLQGDHAQWAVTSVAELERMVQTSAAAATSMVAADPFAASAAVQADPFATGAPHAPAFQPPQPLAYNPPPPQQDARMAMDDAFNAAGDGVGVPTGRPIALYIVGAVVALAAIGGAVFFLTSH